MYLKPLRRDQFDILKPLLKHRLAESNIDKVTSPEYVISKLESFYDMRSAGVYVDNDEAPKHCLIMTHFPGGLIDGIVAFVNLIYTIPEARGDAEAMEVMLRTAENYARLNGATTISGSSWILGGSKGTDAMWTKDGYVPQETVFIKRLT